MRKLLVFSFFLVVTIILTILTQVGGLIYLISKMVTRSPIIKKKRIRFIIFPFLYTFCTFVVVPFIAPLFGRSSLPISDVAIKPHNFITVLLNRHYVSTDFKNELLKISSKFKSETNCRVYYFDANFPFFDGFPLLPHLSHSDGKKIDLSFIYYNDNTKQVKNPSFLGYGNCVPPSHKELDMPSICKKKGYHFYSLLEKLTPNQEGYYIALDYKNTPKMIQAFTSSSRINKLFLEPHLKTRFKLKSSKIRFHGCHAVRHDDHVHVEFN